jgi:hypothetical protein
MQDTQIIVVETSENFLQIGHLSDRATNHLITQSVATVIALQDLGIAIHAGPIPIDLSMTMIGKGLMVTRHLVLRAASRENQFHMRIDHLPSALTTAHVL